MIYENNEEKRSTLWRTVLTVSSVVIVIILIFFIVKLFTGNPLEGSWVSEDSGAVLVIGDDGEVTLTGDAEDEENTPMSYTVDTKTKSLLYTRILLMQKGSCRVHMIIISRRIR